MRSLLFQLERSARSVARTRERHERRIERLYVRRARNCPRRYLEGELRVVDDGQWNLRRGVRFEAAEVGRGRPLVEEVDHRQLRESGPDDREDRPELAHRAN